MELILQEKENACRNARAIYAERTNLEEQIRFPSYTGRDPTATRLLNPKSLPT